MAFYERGNNAVEIEEHGNVNNEASVVAVPTPSAEMPLRDLRRLLEHHKKRRTVRMFLRTLFDTSFDESGNEGLPEDQKSCCSILHFACLDSNGARGEEKIRIILQAAKDARADVPELIATRQEFYSFYGESWEPDHETELTIFTPLLLLMNNKDATIESIRIICQAWPRAVHFHGTCDDYTNIALKSLMYGESSGDVARQVEVVKVLLDAAAKTKEGAMGLVAASDEVKGGVNPESFDYEDFVSEDTALHTVTRYHSRPECFVPLFLEVWPDALKYCSIDVWDHKGTCPLHNAAFHKSHLSYESRIKTIVAFLRGSTLEALAVALLFVGNAKDRVRSYVPNGLGFHLVKELGKETGPGRTLELQAELQATLQALVERKDVKGRTLLHYIAASCTKVNEHEMREKAEGISDANIRARGSMVHHKSMISTLLMT